MDEQGAQVVQETLRRRFADCGHVPIYARWDADMDRLVAQHGKAGGLYVTGDAFADLTPEGAMRIILDEHARMCVEGGRNP